MMFATANWFGVTVLKKWLVFAVLNRNFRLDVFLFFFCSFRLLRKNILISLIIKGIQYNYKLMNI